jgi:hypothetical protein
VGRVDIRIPTEREPVRDHRRVGVENVILVALEEPGELPREGVFVDRPPVADPVHDLHFVTRGHQGGPEVEEDPLYPAVPGRRNRLDPPSDKENPHALPSTIGIKVLAP